MDHLSQDDRDLIRASIPMLQLHGIALAQRIHERLSAVPGMEALFVDVQDRREKLALALIECARQVDRLADHLETLRARAPANVREAIRPEHAAILGHVFKNAMQDVLMMGDADPVLAAWRRAYGQIARMLSSADLRSMVANPYSGSHV